MPLRTSGNSAIAPCTTSRSRSRRHARDLRWSSTPCGRSLRRERQCSRRGFRNRPRPQPHSTNYTASARHDGDAPFFAPRCGRVGSLVKAREDTRFCRTQLYGFSREVMRRLGSDLAAAGCLDSPEDYVHLEAEELLGAFDGTSTHPDLRVLARTRKDAYLRSCDRSALAANLTTAPPPIAAADLRRRAATSATAGSSTELTGLPSSAGIARGRAKLVLRPDVPPSDCAGRILIARETDPGWLPLMLNATGLVVERGSMVSHTAITGRMLGIPTVVAVPGATSKISDGDEVEIDGRSGSVRILRPHSQRPR